ncbi:MAG: type II toxin-antitoxin system PemK/MazF family toxin [Syntrophobacteraceae bacterium]
MRRGEIWWASLPAPGGSEPGYSRPVIIIQADSFTASLIRTVIVVIVTKNIRLADAPGNVFLPRKQTGLPDESVANVSQIFTIDKSYLKEKVSALPIALLRRIEGGMRLVLSL